MAESNASVDVGNLTNEANGRESPLTVPQPTTVMFLRDLAEPPRVVTPNGPEGRLKSWEIGASAVALALGLILLSAGLSVAAQDSINAIQNHTVAGAWSLVGSFFVIATCHTVTNTALLCCVSAFLGVLGYRVIGERSGVAEGFADRRDAYVAAATRGFYIFLIIQSGSIILSNQAFTNLTLEKYIRLAGLSSLLSFTVGYNPDLFRQLMDRVGRNFSAAPPNSGKT